MAEETITKTMTNRFADVADKIKSLDQSFITYVLIFLIIFIVCMVLLNIVYTKRLEINQCSYMEKMYSDVNGKIKSICINSTESSDYLCNYYIKTAYNCCSGGSYKNDYVNVCNLKSVLKQGARCLDFEIYSIDGVPVVSTSTNDNYYVKETYNSMKFADAMKIIQMYGFGDGAPNKADPIILHLRFKSENQEMYKALANIFKSYTTLMLGKQYSYTNYDQNLGLTKLKDLEGKIVLIVDEGNKSFAENIELVEYVNATSNSGNIRIYQYFQAKNCPDIDELENFNKGSYMSIVLPDGGVNPPNPSGDYARELGCQFVAMRYQYVDNFLLSDINFFDEAGYAFCRKPENVRFVPIVIPPPIKQDPALSYAPRDVTAPLGVTIEV
jgi:hypothetical protein